MNLLELKQAVQRAIDAAWEHGENPEDVVVSLQIDRNDQDMSFAQTTDVTLHYDGNAGASGCVLQGWDEEGGDGPRIPVAELLRRTGGYEVAEGADAVRAMIADKGEGPQTPQCSGWRVLPGGEKCPGCMDCRPNVPAHRTPGAETTKEV